MVRDRTSDEGDARIVKTRNQLHEALWRACRDRPLSELSVSEIVRLAEVARATFYLHYPDLRSLAVDACAEPVRVAVDALHAADEFPDPAAPPVAVVDLLRRIRDEAVVYRRLLSPEGGGPLGELLFRELRDRSLAERRRRLAADLDHEVVAAAVAATFTGVLAGWLHERVPGDPEQLAARVWRLLGAIHRS